MAGSLRPLGAVRHRLSRTAENNGRAAPRVYTVNSGGSSGERRLTPVALMWGVMGSEGRSNPASRFGPQAALPPTLTRRSVHAMGEANWTHDLRPDKMAL